MATPSPSLPQAGQESRKIINDSGEKIGGDRQHHRPFKWRSDVTGDPYHHDHAKQRQTCASYVKAKAGNDLGEENLCARERAVDQKRPKVAVPLVMNLQPAKDGTENRATHHGQFGETSQQRLHIVVTHPAGLSQGQIGKKCGAAAASLHQ
jgi:hypothetical protein